MSDELAVAYLRVSTEDQSVEQQMAAIERFAKSRGLKLVRIFADEAVSGTTHALEREKFVECLEFMERSEVRLLIIYSLDRLGRNFTDIFRTLDELTRRGVIVLSVRDSFLQHMDPTIRKIVVALLAWASEMEVKMIRERIRLAMSRSDVREKLARRRVAVPEETKELIASLYKSGHSVKRIAKMVNLSEYAVRKVLIERGLLELGERTCPRCLHKLEWDEIEGRFRCRNCGFLK